MMDYPDVPYARYARLVDHVEKLEAALREIAAATIADSWGIANYDEIDKIQEIARAALEERK